MNKKRLEKEGQKWVDQALISKEQLAAILNIYEKQDRSYLLIILAAVLVSISVIVFIFSDWAQMPNVSRILMMLLIMSAFYVAGFYYERKDPLKRKKQRDMTTQTYGHTEVIGISFIILGYVTFGATLLLTLYMYHIQLVSAWPFFLWSLAGILLYILVPNRYLFSIALLITIYGQVHSSLAFTSFHYGLFLLFFIVYFHYVYHRGHKFVHYLFSIGLVIQLILVTVHVFEQFYWLLFFLLILYGLTIILPNRRLKRTMQQVTIISLLFYKMYETLIVDDSYIMEHLSLQPSFFILHIISFLFIGLILLMLNRRELITLLLFLPLFFVPYAHVWIIISLFVYSIYWLLYSFQQDVTGKMLLGLFSFFLSIFTVIFQYAWETINKSLFFLIAGLILFGISIVLERKRRKDERSISP